MQKVLKCSSSKLNWSANSLDATFFNTETKYLKFQNAVSWLHQVTAAEITSSFTQGPGFVVTHISIWNSSLAYHLKSKNKMNIIEKSFIFGARTRMFDLKSNFKIGQSDLICRGCFKAEATQEHLLVCPSLADNSILNSS